MRPGSAAPGIERHEPLSGCKLRGASPTLKASQKRPSNRITVRFPSWEAVALQRSHYQVGIWRSGLKAVRGATCCRMLGVATAGRICKPHATMRPVTSGDRCPTRTVIWPLTKRNRQGPVSPGTAERVIAGLAAVQRVASLPSIDLRHQNAFLPWGRATPGRKVLMGRVDRARGHAAFAGGSSASHS